MNMNADSGIVTIRSPLSVDETVAKLEAAFNTKGLKLFAVVDHSGEARKAGLNMPETKVLIFGSPAAGIPIMLAAPSAAIDLPLKMLVAEDSVGDVWISHNSISYLQARHGFSVELAARIAGVEALARIVTDAQS